MVGNLLTMVSNAQAPRGGYDHNSKEGIEEIIVIADHTPGRGLRRGQRGNQ